MSQKQTSTSPSVQPSDLENKALTVATEDKAAAKAPESDSHVTVVVAHPIPKGRIGNEEDLRPGDETSVTKYLATSLVQQGVARLAK